MISRTGYTGAGGFEIIVPSGLMEALWECLLKGGAVPAGLGARDTLRLEMGYALYSHEISESIAPTESVAAWAVKLDKKAFLGKEALLQLEKNPEKRHALGIQMVEPGIPRQGGSLYENETKIGKLTSGSFSPMLNQGIALGIVGKKLEEGHEVNVEVRNQLLKAKVVSLPFLKTKG
jgi:aminomethyltransferase